MKILLIIRDSTMDDEEEKRIRNHKKRLYPTRLSLPRDHWDDCPGEKVDSLPGDINGKKLYILPFDPSKRMLSSRDGRNWDTWKTSSNKTYKVRRLAKCKGGWKCVNPQCDFSKTFNKPNSYYLKFETVSSEQVAFCKIKKCEKKCVKLSCECVKIWEFDDNTNLV